MCGIIGVFNHENAAELAALGLFAEQHRGQESCGMAVSDGSVFHLRKKLGLVKHVFTPNHLDKLKGKIAIGHVRYPTRGTSTEYNSQPHVVETLSGPRFALASNGDIINYHDIRMYLESQGVYFKSYNDGELILKYIVFQIEKKKKSTIDAIKTMMKHVKGAFSTVLATPTEMYMFRDPHAMRPMTYGTLENGAVVVASESCALDILAPTMKKELKAAEIIVVNEKGIRSISNDPALYRTVEKDKHCIFEHIYFSRPDSHEFGENVYEVRENIGAQLADGDADIDVDVAVPVPDSSNFIALGYAKRKKIPFEMGLIRNHYVGRTFIKPQQTVRDESVKQKFNPLPNFFKDKKVVLIDDSIVRGTTIKKIINVIKDQGAKEIHLRIGSPQVKFSCFYGIDTPTKDELIANRMSLDEMREYLNVASIKYIPKENLGKCVKNHEEYCFACFTGSYPVE